MNINPGILNKRIDIFRKNVIRTDEDGFPIIEKEIIRSPWANFKRTSGTEITRGNADFSEVNCRFLIRFTDLKIDNTMCILYAGEDYEIKYINNYSDSNEYIEIWTKKVEL